MEPNRGRGTGPALTFTRAAWRYWFTVWPNVVRQAARWRTHAETIPDEVLRHAALQNLRGERGNLEGAAAFAVLVPRRQRPALVRSLVAFQAAYDFVDTLVEATADDGELNARSLHAALRHALDDQADASAENYYGSAAAADDGGYLAALVVACQQGVAELPSRDAIRSSALRAADRMIEYQVHNHSPSGAAAGELAAWAERESQRDSGNEWWEEAASAASSLVVFALLALATRDRVSDDDVQAVVAAYAAAGALHVLLDSFVDRDADALAGDHSLVAHYADAESEGRRLAALAGDAHAAAEVLADCETHRLILAAMASFYLSRPHSDEERRLTAELILDQLGAFALPSTYVLRVRGVVVRQRRERSLFRRA